MSIQSFSNRVLDGIGREYGVIGNISRTDKLDISPPVLVHDASENARATSWIPCSLPGTGLLLTAAATTTVFAEVTRADALAANPAASVLDLLRLAPGEVDIWVFGWSAVATAASAANVSGAALGVRMPQTQGGAGLVVELQEYGTVRVSLTSGGVQELEPLDDIAFVMQMAKPFHLADHGASGFLARLTAGAGGEAVVEFFFHCLLGPKGSLPPTA